MTPLVPRDQLEQYEHLIRPLVEETDPGFPAFANDKVYGAAFKYALFFSEPSVLQQTALSSLTDLEIFYNRYYWFFLFTRLHHICHGEDFGLDQQALKILENAPRDVDWLAVEAIVNQVERETLTYPQP